MRYARCPFDGCHWPGRLRLFTVLTYSPALVGLTLRACPVCNRVARSDQFAAVAR